MAQKFVTPVTIRNLTSASSDGIAVSVDGDTNDRIKVEAGGRIVWGSGSATGDVNLYRSGTGVIKTDHVFEAESGVITLTTSGAPTAALSDGAIAVDTTNSKLYFRSNSTWNVVSSGGATVSDTAPGSPSVGDIWFESDTGDVFVYYDSTWIDIGGTSVANIATSDTAPSSPANGDIWFETDTAKTFVWYDDGSSQQWVEIGAASSSATGSSGSIQFANGNGAFSSDGTNLFWDDTNNRLGVGTNSPAVALDVVGTTDTDYLTVGGENVTPYTGRRNLLINGSMQVAQRGTSSTGTTSAYRSLDRWKYQNNSAGSFTVTQSTDAPEGFSNSYKAECVTADATPVYLYVWQGLEGQDLQHLKKGTSNAKSITLSFWVKSNVVGTFIAALYDGDNDRFVSGSYSVSSSGVWEFKTLTFDGDTSGILDNDNNSSLSLQFWLSASSTYTSGTLQTSWGTNTSANRAVGLTGISDTVGNYWQITGVQLEPGDKATPFEHRSFGEELDLCYRYYYTGSSIETATHYVSGTYYSVHSFPKPMRANPTITLPLASSTYLTSGGSWTAGTVTTLLTNYGTAQFINIRSGVSTGFGVGSGVLCQASGFEASAEF